MLRHCSLHSIALLVAFAGAVVFPVWAQEVNEPPCEAGCSAQSAEPDKTSIERSYLMSSWDLDGLDDQIDGDDLSPLRPHRASYLIVRKTSRTNLTPHSPAPGHTLVTPFDHDATELKFQFSQKAKILRSRNIHFLAFRSFRLWGAYTQQSGWQAFNSRNSSPFRETNYEPELIATLGTGKRHGLKLVNLGWVHQSNGKDFAASRSWNRVYLQGGWESGAWSALARGWWRISEDPLHDDNPDILDYVGRAEIALRWAPARGNEVVDLVLRNNLRKNPNRGFIQIDWGTPVPLSKSTRLHVQLTSGYGESLIDYNHRQTTFGFGFSFRDW